MRSMKKLLLIASLMMASACVCCSTTTDLTAGEEVSSGQQIIKLPSDQQELRDGNESRFVKSFDEVSFKVGNSGYNTFIGDLRKKLNGSASDMKFSYSMMKNPDVIRDSNRFLLVKLSNSAGKLETTLAVRMSDGYVIGFCCGKENTAWFFTAETNEDKRQNNLLFTGASQNYLGYKGNYDTLGNREIPLGPVQMDASIAQLGNTEKNKDTSRNKNSLLVLLQTVAEAARYQYISDKVAASMETYRPFTPDPLMISYENNWGTLSTAVATAVGEGVFKNEVELKDKNGRVIKTVGYVWQLRNELSLLSFVRT